MEKLNTYKKIVQTLLTKYSTYTDKDEPYLQTVLLNDEKKNAFILITMGWQKYDYVHFVGFHLDIKSDGKIWIHENRTDIAIEEELMKNGVQHHDIVLALVQPPSLNTEKKMMTVTS